MDMKRFILLILLIAMTTGTAWAGPRLSLDHANSEASTVLETINVEVGGEAEALVLGEIPVQTPSYYLATLGEVVPSEQTPSMTVVLGSVHDSVFTLEDVLFAATVSHAEDRSIALYEWDLDGDGEFDESSTAAAWDHAYGDEGTYFVRVQASDDLGNAVLSEPFQLIVLNQSPVADLTASPHAVTEGDVIHFESSAYDTDGEIVSWLYDFGDGTTSNEDDPAHVYAEAGVFEVALTVTDNDGAVSVALLAIEIFNAAPEAAFSLQQSVLGVGEALVVTDHSVDPSTDGGIVHVAWDYGDGSFQAGSPSSSGTYSHAYAQAGVFTITLYVIDDNGSMAVAQSTIQVL
ncbi:MAG: PKD domain-containing protein [Candidatus Atribacteria bacterium]|nr:MAG: PKD domain-containing protein [Candidatus Atribacteria bacterium]